MSESKVGSAPGCTATAGAAVASAEAGSPAGVRATADAGAPTGGAAGSSGIVGAVTRSAAPATDGVSVEPSLGHTSTPAGYCVRHRGQADTAASLAGDAGYARTG